MLILDDATSAVDPRVESAILRGLRMGRAGDSEGASQRSEERTERGAGRGMAEMSILVVAYRRATIALADEVVYLERGRVVARGRHADLLATVRGYADLVTAYERADAEREREHAYDEDGDAVDEDPADAVAAGRP